MQKNEQNAKDSKDLFSQELPEALQRHFDDHINGSGICFEVAKERGYRTILGVNELKMMGFSTSQMRTPGLLLPVHTPDGKQPFCQYRPDNPRQSAQGKAKKYETPADIGMRIDVPPRCRESLKNPDTRLWVTEGIKKGDALASRGETVIALLGVWNFKGKNEFGGTTLLADLDYIAWDNRKVSIVFDSDIIYKSHVRLALMRLTEHLKRKGAIVFHVYLPKEGNIKVGVDDYLLNHTIEELLLLERPAKEIEIEREQERQSQADRLVKLFMRLPITLFHDEANEPYVKFKVTDRFEVWKIRSKPFKRWLGQQFWTEEKKVLNTESLNSALNIIEAAACFNGKQYTLQVRVAWDENTIFYDLGDWKAVAITKDGWEIVNDPPILFRHYPHQKAQIAPEECSEEGIFEVFRFVNLPKPKGKGNLLSNEQLLFLTNLVVGLIPDIPHPIDVLHGDQGSAKTTFSRIKKELLDPSAVETLTYPKNAVEFVQLASHHWAVPLDNLTHLQEWLSDALCRTVTGDGFSKRELYTDDDDVIYKFKRCIFINGINLVATKPDLLDRSLIFELEPISQEARIEEKRFWDEFNKAKPKLLGALFTLLSKTLKEYPNVELSNKPRMADFAMYGCAVARALGMKEDDFMEAYLTNIGLQNQEALGASPVAQTIIAFMQDRALWEGSPSELLDQLNTTAEELKFDIRDKKYPRNARWLWRRIKEVRTNLQAIGILAERDDSDRDSTGRKIILKKITLPTKQEDQQDDYRPFQQGKKNDVSDDIMSKNEESQDVTPDNTTDIINENENDVRNNVRHNYAEILEPDNTDNTDNISETILVDEDLDSWEDEVKEFLSKAGGS